MSATLSSRAEVFVALFIILSCLGCRFLDAEQPSAASRQLRTATLAVGVVAGSCSHFSG